jgi:hypothetical protein
MAVPNALEGMPTGSRFLVHGRVRPIVDVTTIEEALRKLQVSVKVAQGRIVFVEPELPQSSI